jgi:two-component system, chemotaxis family, CheB/CheR fusion protein
MTEELNPEEFKTIKVKEEKYNSEDPGESVKGRKNFCIGIGASAGGLEALEQFFKNMPADSGLSFVVVQHLSPDYKSLMVELLSKHTKMKVLRAEDAMKVMPNCIYLIPPRKNLTIFHNKLFLTEQLPQHSINLPIDIFFRSLADDFGDRAIGIILSGTGSDGTLGIRAIKGTGGMAMVQDDNSAKFDGMPKSAIATGLVDYILPADKMPAELLKFIKHPLSLHTEEKSETYSDENMLGKVMAIIRNQVGVDFTYYKPNTIIRRLERRITINQIDSVEDYVSFLERSSKEVNILYKELLIGVTRFFRDTDGFDIIRNQIIPNLFKNKKKEETIRVWCVGCSTGEEAYSLAILLKEYMEEIDQVNDVKIFSTDLDKESIEFGSMGFYTESIVTDVSAQRLKKYFIKKDKGYQINENIRKMVIFATHNIIKDPPFSKIDLVSCRNMLIYLKPVMQKKVLSLFHFSLSRSGYLFLGSSESLGDLSKCFNTIDSKWKIYSYKEGKAGDSIKEFMIPNIRRSRLIPQNNNSNEVSGNNELSETVFNSIINDFVPPSLIVNDDYEIIHVCKDVNQYVMLPPGKISLNILSLIKPELNTAVSTAIHKAIKEKKEVIYKDYKLKQGEKTQVLDIKVKPISDPGKNRQVIFIVFDEKKTLLKKAKRKDEITIEYDINQQINDLELELKYTKENLQATIEELGTSNEELQSTNEELISSNEELQSTNEELQSVNEELYTVNSEYQNKIEELTQLNNDINNLLKNTNIGTVFLDRNFLIRKFTPAVSEAINILDMDIGRPIHHISHNTLYTRFIDDIENVLRTLVPKETEVQGKKDNWFLMRILPYRTLENAIDGVVITFLDITERKRFEENIKRERELFMRVIENSPNAKVLINKDGKITFANKLATEVLKITDKDIQQGVVQFESLKLKATGKLNGSENIFEYIIKTGLSVYNIEHQLKTSDSEPEKLFITGSPIFDESKDVTGTVLSIDQYKHEKLRNNLIIQQYKILLDIVPLGIYTLDKDCIITSWNKKAEEITSISSAEIVGTQCQFISDNNKKTNDPCLYFKNSEKPIICKTIQFELRSIKSVIEAKTIDFIKDENNQVIGAIGCFDHFN